MNALPTMCSSASSTALNRNYSVDLGRFWACLAIIWIHTAESKAGVYAVPSCRWAVPYFISGVVVFAFVKSAEPSYKLVNFNSYLFYRFKRLYVPFIAWSLVYLLLRGAKHLIAGEGSPIIWSPAMLLNGTTNHLWFLPFAFLASLACYWAGRLSRLRPTWKANVSVCYAVLALVFCVVNCPVQMDPEEVPVSYFLGLCWDALPSVFGALAVACYPRRSASWFPVALILAGSCFLGLLLVGENRFLANGCGLALFVACWTKVSLVAPREIPLHVARYSFGIYLSHIVFVEGFQVVASKVGVPVSLGKDAVVFAGSLVASLATAILIEKSSWSPYLIPK